MTKIRKCLHQRQVMTQGFYLPLKLLLQEEGSTPLRIALTLATNWSTKLLVLIKNLLKVITHKFEKLRFDCGNVPGYIDSTNITFSQLNS